MKKVIALNDHLSMFEQRHWLSLCEECSTSENFYSMLILLQFGI